MAGSAPMFQMALYVLGVIACMFAIVVAGGYVLFFGMAAILWLEKAWDDSWNWLENRIKSAFTR
jgi:hypothetical protein